MLKFLWTLLTAKKQTPAESQTMVTGNIVQTLLSKTGKINSNQVVIITILWLVFGLISNISLSIQFTSDKTQNVNNLSIELNPPKAKK